MTPDEGKMLYKAYMESRGYRSGGIKTICHDLKIYTRWLGAQKVEDIRDVQGETILTYLKYLRGCEGGTRKRTGRRYKDSTINDMMGAVRRMFHFLMKNEYILSDPCEKLELGIKTSRTMRQSIPRNEMETLLEGIPQKEPLDIRDAAIFECMYGTGLRISEVAALTLADVDLSAGRILVRDGKGGKERIVPMGEHLQKVIRYYLEHGRAEHVKHNKEGCENLFVSRRGRRITPEFIQDTFRKRQKELLQDAKYTPHNIRHSFATHMLEGGAGIKQVKEILGHESIQTTVGYTHFNVKSLKKVMYKYHPRENGIYREMSVEERKRYCEILGCATD